MGTLGWLGANLGDSPDLEPTTLTFSNSQVQCELRGMSTDYKTPSLKSFIRASKAMEDQELRLSGLDILKTRQCASTAS